MSAIDRIYGHLADSHIKRQFESAARYVIDGELWPPAVMNAAQGYGARLGHLRLLHAPAPVTLFEFPPASGLQDYPAGSERTHLLLISEDDAGMWLRRFIVVTLPGDTSDHIAAWPLEVLAPAASDIVDVATDFSLPVSAKFDQSPVLKPGNQPQTVWTDSDERAQGSLAMLLPELTMGLGLLATHGVTLEAVPGDLECYNIAFDPDLVDSPPPGLEDGLYYQQGRAHRNGDGSVTVSAPRLAGNGALQTISNQRILDPAPLIDVVALFQ